MSRRGMKMSLLLTVAPVLAAGATAPRTAPLVDYHQHLVSRALRLRPPSGCLYISSRNKRQPTVAPIVKLPERNAAGIERAIVLSVGYSFADERKGLIDPDRLTREAQRSR